MHVVDIDRHHAVRAKDSPHAPTRTPSMLLLLAMAPNIHHAPPNPSSNTAMISGANAPTRTSRGR